MFKSELSQYSYDILVKSVTLALPGSVKVFVMIKRGDQKVETKSQLKIDKETNVARFNELVHFLVDLPKNKSPSQEKKAKVGVYAISSSNKIKTLGECLIDLAPFAKEPGPTSKTYKLHNCIDKNAMIELEVGAVPLNKKMSNPCPRKGDVDDTEWNVTASVDMKNIGKEGFAQKLNPSFIKPEPHPDLEMIRKREEMKHEALVPESKGQPYSMTPQTNAEKILREAQSPDLNAKYNQLKEKALKFRKERDIAREEEAKLKQRIEELEEEKARLKVDRAEGGESNEQEKIAELEDELRLYREKVTQLNKQTNELNLQYNQAASESARTSGLAEQYRKDNEELSAKIKTFEAERSKYNIEADNNKKTIESLKVKVQEMAQKLDSKGVEESAMMAAYKEKTEGIIADLKKQLKEKESVITQKEQLANDTSLELQQMQKYSEGNEASLRNEIELLKKKKDEHKKRENELHDTFQSAKAGSL
jgi:chromosome segregation ATPase